MDRNRYVALAVVFLILLAVLRILLTYKVTSQAFDEPCHVAAAIELLDRGTYTLDPVHPQSVSRFTWRVPVFLAGPRAIRVFVITTRLETTSSTVAVVICETCSSHVPAYFRSSDWL